MTLKTFSFDVEKMYLLKSTERHRQHRHPLHRSTPSDTLLATHQSVENVLINNDISLLIRTEIRNEKMVRLVLLMFIEYKTFT
jgi:hypothetical protein